MLSRKTALACTLGIWAAVVGAGTREMLRYGNTPGAPASPQAAWPAAAPLALAKKPFTLLLFAHPQCPCTRASIEELSRLMTSDPGHLDATIVFFAPSRMPAEWSKGDLWRSAQAIPGVRLVADRDGVAARQFGALTSGQVLLYDAAGQLRFQGGITASRGQFGDSEGAALLQGILRGKVGGHQRSHVFGCALAGE